MSDVYAPPKAELHDQVKNGQYGSVEQALIGNYQLNIKEVFSEAWGKTKGAKGTIFAAAVIPTIISFAITFFLDFVFKGTTGHGLILKEVGGQLLISLITLPMYAGFFMLGIKRSVGASLHISELFQYWHKVLPLLGLFILTYLMILIGAILLVLPGIYLMFAYSMSVPLVVEKDMGVWQAMETSRKAVTKKWFTIFGYSLTSMIIFMIGFLALIIGLFWATPLVIIAYGIVYRNMFGVEEKTLNA